MLSNNRTIIQSIKGGVAQDQRGQIRFVNDFDMSLVKDFISLKMQT